MLRDKKWRVQSWNRFAPLQRPHFGAMQATLSSKAFLRESFLPALAANAFPEFAQNLLHGTSTLTFVSCVPAVHSVPRLASRPVPCPQGIAGSAGPVYAQALSPSRDIFLP